jgi:coenzyme F420-reducing hydrogenase delta subunit
MVETDIHILALACEHCAYAAADLAGGLRMQYPPAVKIVHAPLHRQVGRADGAGRNRGGCRWSDGSRLTARRLPLPVR